MVSQKARDAFYRLYNMAIKETLNLREGSANWDIRSIDSVDKIRAREFIVLTMCSYDFRLFTTLHFTGNIKTIEYVANSLNISIEEVNRRRLYDYLGEYGNNYCGTFKRELGQIFPHLGMSTPDRLEERAFSHFKELKYEYALNSEVTNAKGVALYFGLYACPYGELDFDMPSRVETAVTGELELF